MIPHIESTSNPKIKWVKSLHKNSTRRDEGVFVVEGAKEIAAALDGGFEPMAFFVCPEIYGELDLRSQFLELKKNSESLRQTEDDELPNNQGQSLNSGTVLEDGMYSVSKEVFEKITYRGSSDGMLAVMRAKKHSLERLTFDETPFFLIIESVEKPGNLGAIVRSADGAGVDAVIICDQKTDIYNPNCIRASLGTVFSKQIAVARSNEVFDFLEKHEISAFGATLSDQSTPYTLVNFSDPTAIILGTEHEGLSDFWQERTKPIIIPMLGSNDSLNVSNAAAVLAYEVHRQRYEHTNLA